MKQYTYITHKTIDQIASCFSDEEEVAEFFLAIDELGEKLFKASAARRKRNEGQTAISALEQICTLLMFFRMNIDLMNELLKNFDVEILTQEQLLEKEAECKDQSD
jgi:hypothetical protein